MKLNKMKNKMMIMMMMNKMVMMMNKIVMMMKMNKNKINKNEEEWT